jgi:hypothetical protein
MGSDLPQRYWSQRLGRTTSKTFVPSVLERYRLSNTFRKNPNRFRLEDPTFMLLGVSRSRLWLSRMKRGRGTPASCKKATKETPMSVCSKKGIDRWLVT